VNGYDEFYSFWGMEDNDLEHRLKQDEKHTIFYKDEILVYHQHHDPAHIDHSVIPEGWKVFQADYYNSLRYKTIRNDDSWGKLYQEKDRPALNLYYNSEKNFTEITGRVHYFTYCLAKALHQDNSEFKFKVKDTFSAVYVSSNLGRFIKKFNKTFSSLPFQISTKYYEQFSQILYYRDAFIYFVWHHKPIISDYYFEVTRDELFVSVVKRDRNA
jgi:hypothetical protein